MRRFILPFVVLVFFFGVTCSDSGNGNGDGGDKDASGQDGSNGTDKKQDGGGGDFPICNEEEIKATPLSNLLLVVDKSNSMKDPTAAGSNRTKAQDLVEAVRFLLDTYEGTLRLGWMAFPFQSDCDPGVVSVGVGNDSADTIRDLLDNFIPWGKTPTGETLQNADSYYTQLNDTERTNFVVLVTDGLPTCPNGNGQPDPADDALALQAVETLFSHDVGTFVIGLGEDLNNSNPALLNDMAVAGGHPRARADKYYPANNQADLEAAFKEIAKVVMECHLDLESWPDDPDYLWVYFDNVAVPRDPNHLNGWDYDEINNRVDFYGNACDQLRNGEVIEAEVKMGCSPP